MKRRGGAREGVTRRGTHLKFDVTKLVIYLMCLCLQDNTVCRKKYENTWYASSIWITNV